MTSEYHIFRLWDIVKCITRKVSWLIKCSNYALIFFIEYLYKISSRVCRLKQLGKRGKYV